MGLALLTTSCIHPRRQATDREAYAIQAEKTRQVELFRRDELVDPLSDPVERPQRQSPIDLPEILTLREAIRIATEYNRDYQIERETLFIQSLSLGLTRRDFLRPVFSGSVSYNGTDGKSRSYGDVTSLSLGGTQLFSTGAELNVDSTASIVRSQGTDGRDQTSSLSSSISLTQPLLRGAGHEVAFETLTQAERELLYDARAFELFRQSFVVSVIRDYYGLVTQKKQLKNTRDRITQQARALEQAEALFNASRGSKLDSLRAKQSLLRAESTALSAEQRYAFALDRFKIRMGLPIDVTFDVADEIPEPTMLEVDTSRALAAALKNRLDLVTEREQLEDQERAVRIARNGLLPNLDLGVSYAVDSEQDRSFRRLRYYDTDLVTVSATLEIPLDRKRERNTYRTSMIQLARARRGLDESEDDVITEVRDALLGLGSSREQIRIGIEEIRSFELSAEKAQIDLEAGTVTNRDVVEAQDELATAKNDQLQRMADYEVNRLELLRVVGILFVDEEGQVQE